jgi:hypothetical protein
MKIPDWVQNVLDGYEVSSAAFMEIQIGSALGAGARAHENMPEEDKKGYLAEAAVFSFSERREKDTVWGTYFAPMTRWTQPDGTEFRWPDVADLDAATIEHWQSRAKAATNSVMRSRYADAVWDLTTTIIGEHPSYEFAQVAIDAYIGATEKALYSMSINGIQWLGRALDLSLSIRDEDRIRHVIESMFMLYDKVSEAQYIGTWTFLFDNLYDNETLLSEKQRGCIIAHLESMLAITTNREELGGFDPFGAEAAAERLARHYEHIGSKADVQRVTKLYGESFQHLAGQANSIVAVPWLQPVAERYRQVGLRDEAEKLELTIEEKGKGVEGELKRIEVKLDITPEQIEQLAIHLTEGDLKMSLARIGDYFIPDVDKSRTFLKEMRDRAPLLSMIKTVTYEGGRPSSSIGTVDDDPEGTLHSQLADRIGMLRIFLIPTLAKLKEKLSPTPEGILNFLFESPIFANARPELLNAGLEAYLNDDYAKAIHILIPQIEQRLRNLLAILRIPTNKPVKGQPGIMDAKSMNDALRQERVRTALPENLWRYLSVLYVDRRGINFRNNVAHGLVPPEAFNRPMADQVFHSLLALGSMRTKEPDARGNTDSTLADTDKE